MRQADRVFGATAVAVVLFASLTAGQVIRRLPVVGRGTATVTSARVSLPAAKAPCPKTVVVAFVVKVSRPGTLHVRRVSSDGSTDTGGQTVTFDRAGEFNLASKLPDPISWTFAGPFHGWVGVHFDASPAGDADAGPSGRTARIDVDCPATPVARTRLGGLQRANDAPPQVQPQVQQPRVQPPPQQAGQAQAQRQSQTPSRRGTVAPRLLFPGLREISPVVVQTGGADRRPSLTTLSPYFPSQIQPKATGRGGAAVNLGAAAGKPAPRLTSLVEVEATNIAQRRPNCFGPDASDSGEFGCHRAWSDAATVKVGRPGDPGFSERFNRVTFRWTSSEIGVVGARWQVSLYPFAPDAGHWADRDVAGLVDSGPVADAFIDAEGFHQFQIDFSRSANGGGPGSLVRVAAASPAAAGGMLPGRATAARLPQGRRPVKPLPGAVAQAPGRLGIVQPGLPPLRSAGTTFVDMNRTLYVRVVPMHGGGQAGLPSLPVEITVTRPQLCPAQSFTQNSDIVVRPPSAKVVSFVMTSFVPTFIQTDQNGKLVGRAHYVSIAAPPGCGTGNNPNPMFGGDPNCTMFNTLAHGQVGYHFFVDPPDTHWYDTAWDIVKGLFSAFEGVVNGVSSAWNQLEAFVVKVVADAIQVVTFNMVKCGESAGCQAVLSVALKSMMAASGIPPTLPNTAELENLSIDYLAKVGAEQLGAGGILDTAEGIYDNLPAAAKQEIEGKASETAAALSNAFANRTGGAAAGGAGSWFMPDPLYYQPHPAYLMVKVFNPNAATTDPVSLHYGDSAGLYHSRDPVYIPALAPGASTVVPIVLEERFDSVYSEKDHCTRDAYESICGDICIPCYWNLWVFAAERLSDTPAGGDTFWVGMTTRRDGRELSLGTASSGKKLGSEELGPPYNDYGEKCAVSHANVYLKYPNGWKMTVESLKQDLRSLMWLNYRFSEGDRGLMK